MIFSATVSLLALAHCSNAITYCPFLGAVYPVPRNINSNSLTQGTVASLTATLDQAVREEKTVYGAFSSANNSFSISVISANEDKPIFQYHHTASHLDNSSTKSVTGDTVFRIGSLSKLFTVFALLLEKGTILFDDPVTKYIPELADIAKAQASGTFDPVSEVQWKDITIGALASHLAGIGRDYNNGDYAGSNLPGLGNAFPPLNSSEIPNCTVVGKYPACSRNDFFRGFTARHPVLPPFTAPVYSNAGFTILGYVVEKLAGQSYEAAVDRSILRPLGLTHSSVPKPSNDTQGIIPMGGKVLFEEDFGNEGPAGGIYSSTNDLSKLARAILKSSLLSPIETRRWLKPRANTATLQRPVGAPWEIQRVVRNTSDMEVIDLYTKSGNAGLYNSLVVLIPDYEVAFTVLTAGDSSSLVEILSEIIAETFLPAIYQISKQEAAGAFGGIYTSTGAINSSLCFVSDGGPGLLIDRWISNSTDLLKYYQQVSGGAAQVRVYPMGLKSPARNGNSSAEVAWRAVFQPVAVANSTYRPRQIWNDDCSTWFTVDAIVYGHNGVDDFVFQLDQYGNAVSVTPRALRINLGRKSN